jgi:hypothetical protein
MKTPKQIADRLKAIHIELVELEQILSAEAGTLPLKDEVEIGQALWHIGNMTRACLDPVKESLRVEAGERSAGNPGTQFLHGRTGKSRCTVNIPHPQATLRGGLTHLDVVEALGPQTPLYFNITATPRPDFHAQVETEPGALPALTRLLDTRHSTPRVTFNN